MLAGHMTKSSGQGYTLARFVELQPEFPDEIDGFFPALTHQSLSHVRLSLRGGIASRLDEMPKEFSPP